MASDEVSGKNEMTRSFHHPDRVGAGVAGGVEALRIGKLEGLKAERWGKKSGGQKQQQAGAGQQAR